jgi:hypothetical protein
MDVSVVVAVFDGILKGILGIGASAIALTLGAAGLCTMFSWLDMHIGGFVKKVFASVLIGGSMMAGGGAFGLWVSNTLKLGSSGTAPTVPGVSSVILGFLGLN